MKVHDKMLYQILILSIVPNVVVSFLFLVRTNENISNHEPHYKRMLERRGRFSSGCLPKNRLDDFQLLCQELVRKACYNRG